MADDPRARDDNLMERFDVEGLRRFSARQAIIAVLITAVLLVLFSGASIRKQGEELKPGIGRDIVLGVGKPAGWVADRLPLNDLGNKVTAVVAANDDLGGQGGFDQPISSGQTSGKVPPIGPENFDPLQLGGPVHKRPLDTLLVTGDSLSTPLDLEIARRLTPDGVNVIRDPHLATGISNTTLVDWGELSTSQVAKDHPDAVVVFIGANEGYSMPGPGGKQVTCCGPDWAAVYAGRARQMMDTYRQAGAGQVFWLTVPTPRDSARQRIERAVNEAIAVAAQPWRDQVHLIDTIPVFTPGDRYRDAMHVGGSEKIVRESDGIHLNETGSGIAADLVVGDLEKEFTH
jgi:lysophospholipase L1-like esterase